MEYLLHRQEQPEEHQEKENTKIQILNSHLISTFDLKFSYKEGNSIRTTTLTGFVLQLTGEQFHLLYQIVPTFYLIKKVAMILRGSKA